MSPATQTSAPAINNYSDELRALLDKFLPKEGEVLIFRQLYQEMKRDALNENDTPVQFMKGPRGLRLKRLESILDPGTGRPITIALLRGYVPNPSTGQLQPNVEEINFSSSGNNLIYVDATDPLLAERLLLSNKNRDCINPRKVEPETGYAYEQVKPEATAETAYQQRRKVTAAHNAIDALDAEALHRMVGKLSLPTQDNGRRLSDDELRLRLAQRAEVEPERITNLVDSQENKLEELVARAVKLGLLDFVDEAQQWRWKATQEPITEAMQGHKPEAALIRYIQANPNGVKFSQMLVSRVKQEEDKAKKK